MGLVGRGMAAKGEVEFSCWLSGVDAVDASFEVGGLQLLIL